MTEKNTSPRRRGAPAIAPGRLRNWVEMTIQTRQAQHLVNGRRGADGKPEIIGLILYGSIVRIVWSGAAKDDPYADWRLLQLEQVLTESRDEIAHQLHVLDRDLNGVTAMKVGLAQSMKPSKVELTFSSPYGYMGAWLLADMDELVLATLTARHVGLLKRADAERRLYDAGRAVRRAFAAVQGYRFMAVTRQDVREGNRRAERARNHMGELPQAVIEATLRPEHAPAIEVAASKQQGGHPVATADNEQESPAIPAAEIDTKDKGGKADADHGDRS